MAFINVDKLKLTNPKQYEKFVNLVNSKLYETFKNVSKNIDKSLTNELIVKALNQKGNKAGKRYLYNQIRQYVNIVRGAMQEYGYIAVDLFGRAKINKYIGLLQKAGFDVNKIKPKINIAKLHKQVHNFQNSFDIKLSDINLFRTTSRITVLESASKTSRQHILDTFKLENPRFTSFTRKATTVHPWVMENAGLDEQTQTLMTRLQRIGWDNRINVSNSQAKKYYVNLEDYSRTWAKDIASRANFLTTSHLAEATGNYLVKVVGTGGCCDRCAQYVDKVFTLDPSNTEYEYLAEEFPLHPNCDDIVINYIEGLDELSSQMLDFYGEPNNYRSAA
jgi:hypothetical protein